MMSHCRTFHTLLLTFLALLSTPAIPADNYTGDWQYHRGKQAYDVFYRIEHTARGPVVVGWANRSKPGTAREVLESLWEKGVLTVTLSNAHRGDDARPSVLAYRPVGERKMVSTSDPGRYLVKDTSGTPPARGTPEVLGSWCYTARSNSVYTTLLEPNRARLYKDGKHVRTFAGFRCEYAFARCYGTLQEPAKGRGPAQITWSNATASVLEQRVFEGGKHYYYELERCESPGVVGGHVDAEGRLAESAPGGATPGVRPDVPIRRYDRAVESSYAEGMKYLKGEGRPRSKAHAFNYLRDAAQEGHLEAQMELAYQYASDGTFETDIAQSIYWFRKAAEQGFGPAESLIEEAVAGMRRGAQSGNAEMQYQLALNHLEDDIVEKDVSRAVAWFRKAAEQGHVKAQFKLGDIYYEGEIVPRDLGQAARFYETPAEQGFIGARYHLGLIYKYGQGVEPDHRKAFGLLKQLAEDGIWQAAQYELADMYEQGIGTPVDLNEALRWYQKLAGTLMFSDAGADVKRVKGLIRAEAERLAEQRRREREAERQRELAALRNQLERFNHRGAKRTAQEAIVGLFSREPTEKDIHQAYYDGVVTAGDAGLLALKLALVQDLEKLGCRESGQFSGYNCDVLVTAKTFLGVQRNVETYRLIESREGWMILESGK